jgi:hypothetical protein
MTNKYYSIGVTTPIANIDAALIDKYGTYNVSTNPTGALIHYSAAAGMVFSCTRLSNKVIKVLWSASCLLHSYGDAWTSGTTITNEVVFNSTNTTGSSTEIHLVLGDYTYLVALLQGTHISRLSLVGKMTNDDYGVLGLDGSSSTTYNTGCIGRNTTDNTAMRPSCWEMPFTAADGKLYKQVPALYVHGGIGLELNSDGSFAFFQDVYNASYNNTASTLVLGATFLLTTGNMYMDGATLHLRTCLLMEFEAAP